MLSINQMNGNVINEAHESMHCIVYDACVYHYSWMHMILYFSFLLRYTNMHVVCLRQWNACIFVCLGCMMYRQLDMIRLRWIYVYVSKRKIGMCIYTQLK
jgi:hypothetical protein